MDKTKLIERAQATLATRQASLKDTLEEIALLEGAGAPPQAIAAARSKRDRQNNSCLASEQLITALTGKITKK